MTTTTAASARPYDAGHPRQGVTLAIAQDASSTTLLTYSAYVTPDPLQVSANGTVMLNVTNSTRQLIACTQLVVTLPVGTLAKDLTANATGIQTTPATGWQVAADGGAFTFTPTGSAGSIGADALALVFAAIAVNDQPGTATVTIQETASSPAFPTSATRTTTIPVPKFPAEFSLSELAVSAPPDGDVAYNGTATLMWTGTGAQATYTIAYQPADSGPLMTAPVGNVGPYTSGALTRSDSVTFTLSAQVTVPGQDQPLVVPRQTTVTVEAVSLSFEVQPPAVGTNGLVQLQWNAANADHCTLEDGTQLAASGVYYLALENTRTFTLTAYDSAGNQMQQQQRSVSVDPAIVPTEAGYTIAGAAGGAGTDAFCMERYAGAGHRGSDGILSGSIPVLDTTNAPTRVIPIAVTGGTGGPGGRGMVCGGADGTGYEFDGMGGDGGNAVIDAVFDPSAGGAAQYIVTLTPGAPGDRRALLGTAPVAGTVSITIIDPT